MAALLFTPPRVTRLPVAPSAHAGPRTRRMKALPLRGVSGARFFYFPESAFERKPERSLTRFALGKESNVASENKTAETDAVGPSEEEKDEKDIADIFRALDLLKKTRDMTFEEARLTIMIEDPREAEKRLELGIENESGCSRDELADALSEVYNGQKPKDRLTLRTLAEEMRNWPNLDESLLEKSSNPRESLYARVTNTGVDPALAARNARLNRKDQWDEATEVELEESKDLGQVLPSWMGYSVIYGVSIIPILIGVAVVVILFLNSLQ